MEDDQHNIEEGKAKIRCLLYIYCFFFGDTLTFNDIPHSITSGFINLQITHEPTKSLGIKTE